MKVELQGGMSAAVQLSQANSWDKSQTKAIAWADRLAS